MQQTATSAPLLLVFPDCIIKLYLKVEGFWNGDRVEAI